MANYEVNERGSQITVTFPDGGQPCYGAMGRWGYKLPHGFVISVMGMEQCDGGGSIMVEVQTLTPETKRVEFDAIYDDRGTNEYGDTYERAGIRFYIGDDRV